MMTAGHNTFCHFAMPFMSVRVLALVALVIAAPSLTHAQDAEIMVRMNQIENSLRQLTGQVEELQFRNQQLEQQLRALQDGGARPTPPPVASTVPRPQPGAIVAPGPVETPPGPPGRRSDAFDPNQSPGAPGVPRPLGAAVGAAPPSVATVPEDVGIPGGRQPGAPLDLSTLSGNAAVDSSAGARVPQIAAVAPPTNSPKDEFDLGYGYMLRHDYALADQTFRGFLSKYPSDRLAADAQFWLGESLFQRQSYRDAANAFLDMSKKYESHGKAPEALLRLGQSLAALNEKELACATFGEVGRKYPRAAATVKQTIEREQKRVRC